MVKSQSHVITIFMVMIISIYSFFSAVKLNSSIVCMLCVLCSMFLIISNHGKITMNIVYKLWIFDLVLSFVSIIITSNGIPTYNFIVFTLLLMGIATVSVAESINVNSIVKILVLFSLVSVIVVALEMIFKGTLVSILSIILPQDSVSAELRRLSQGQVYRGLASYPNVISMASAILLYYALWMMDKSTKGKRLSVLIVSVFGILVAAERSNLVFIPLALFFVYYFYGDKGKAIRALKIIAIFAIAAFVFFAFRSVLTRNYFFERIYNSIDLFLIGESISSSRNNMTSVALMAWKEKPLFGNGWFHFFYNNKGILFDDNFTHAHNFVVELLCDCGLFGLFMVIIPMAVSLIKNMLLIKQATVMNNNIFKFTLAMQLLFIMDSLLHVSFYSVNMIGFYFIMVMLVCIAEKQIGKNYAFEQ